ncbi:hypothetical protein HK101_001578 [Irineochytrium annulatum]|nr:hypothetical protein HK101_001578 [Irineochytrium annulatum]
MMATTDRVIIVGGVTIGITGAAVAFYLSQRGVKSILIEAHPDGVAHCASGKAGGFLARDWSDGKKGEFARKSFDLHADLAEKYSGEKNWWYRRVTTHSGVLGAKKQPSVKGKRPDGDRLPDCYSNISGGKIMGTTETTAQCHPRLLTEFFVRESGCEVIRGMAAGIEFGEGRRAIGVKVALLDADGTLKDPILMTGREIVLTMGPWAGTAKSWGLRLPEMSPVKAHSVVLGEAEGLTADCFFLSFGAIDPEIYPRPDGTAYVCGESEIESVPVRPEDVTVEAERTTLLEQAARLMSPVLKEAQVITRQACFLPYSSDNNTILGPVPNTEGLFIATGNGCWGILLGPASGLAIAELVCDGKSSTFDLRPFNPARG